MNIYRIDYRDGLKDKFVIEGAVSEKDAAENFKHTNPTVEIIKVEYCGESIINKTTNNLLDLIK